MGLRVARLLPAPGGAAARRLAGAAARPPLPSPWQHSQSCRGALSCASAAADAAGSTAAATGGTPAPAALAAQAQAQAASRVAPDADSAELSTADLQRFIEERGIAAEVVPPLSGAAPPPGCCELKSLIFLAGGQPVVLVLPLAARVDERRLAALLHTGRNRLRLAPAGALPELCGYTVGNVPPFGHRRPLPVIVDSSVTAYQTCYAGGGSETAEIFLSVRELLRATSGTVADIATAGSLSSIGGSSNGSGLPLAEMEAAAADEPANRQLGAAAAAAAALPRPWQPGQEEVTLEGIIAHRRKIARLLLFANLVPPAPVEQAAAAAPASPKPGTASYMRRLWRDPGSGRPTEVQLILGATLGRNLGSEAAAELLRGLKTGQCVRVTGRVQPHLQRADATQRPRTDICDVVVHSIQLIDSPPALATTTGLAAAAAEVTRAATAASPGSTGTAGTAGGLAGTQRAAVSQPALPYYQLPPAVQAHIVLVDSEEGLALMEQALFPDSSSGGMDSSSHIDGMDTGSSSSTSSSSSSGGSSSSGEPRGFGPPVSPFRLVVGIDCEWQPYSTRLGDAKTPVSLLQVATPEAVFLLDLLTLCGQQPSSSSLLDCIAVDNSSAAGGSNDCAAGSSATHSTASSSSSAGDMSRAEQPQGGSDADALPPLQARLSALLLRLFGDSSIIKAGFGLQTDISRLCESYPWLPCFGAEGPVPLRSHVDVLLLARTALGTALPQVRRRISLSGLTEAVLGRGLDKAEQCSAWGQRPLRPEQLLYAAADAHSLVALYKELNRRRVGLDSPFWVSHFSGRLTDVAAFHPRTHRSSRSSSSSSSASTLSSSSLAAPSVRRSAVSWRERKAQRLAEEGAGAAEAGGRSQTQQLDANLPYLLNTYLGRQLPQGGKAAVVRAAAAHMGRPESGQTPRFPRGCGGLLEWRNGFTLFVNLPEAGGGDGGNRAYPNSFFWLPPDVAGAGGAAGGVQRAGTGGMGATAASSPAQPLPAEVGGANMWRQGWRLCMTWWPGRGQTEEHPVIQRLLAAGSGSGSTTITSSGGTSGSDAGAAVTAVGDAAAASPDEQQQQQQQQQAVLLFCRAGGGPYTFCGRLRLAETGDSSSSSSSSSIESSSSTPRLGADGSLCWELLDAPAMLSGEAGSGFGQLLFT